MSTSRTRSEYSLLRAHPRASAWFALAIGLQVVALLAQLGQLALIAYIVHGVFVAGQSLQEHYRWLGAAIGLVGLRALTLAISETILQRSANLVKGALRQRVSAHLLQLGPRFSASQRSGSLIQILGEHIEALDDYISQFMPAKLLAGIGPLIVLLVVLWIDPISSLVLLFAGPILVILLALIGQKTRILTDKRFADLRWMSAYFLDMLRGLPTLKLFGRSREQVAQIAEIGLRYSSTTMDVLRTAFQTSLVLEWGATAATALVAIEVSWRMIGGWMPFGLALTVLLIAPEFFAPLRLLAQRYHAGTAGNSARREIEALLDQPQEKQIDALIKQAPQRFTISFENVSLGGRDESQPILKALNLTIEHASLTALVGSTGAGKSSILSLLLGFMPATSGTIRIDDKPLASFDRESWRSWISYVPQHPHLFNGNVRDNIALGKPNASQAEIEEAAKAACIHELILGLPKGYDSLLGENGARLSGGQRQRIALARAFLRDAPLILLDEPTAHLDAKLEEHVMHNLRAWATGKTVLLITHRLHTAAAADQIILLEKGQISAQGDHKQLIEQSERYRRLLQAPHSSAPISVEV
jgi:ATP-binding cassette subfamily C protein CydD